MRKIYLLCGLILVCGSIHAQWSYQLQGGLEFIHIKPMVEAEFGQPVERNHQRLFAGMITGYSYEKNTLQLGLDYGLMKYPGYDIVGNEHQVHLINLSLTYVRQFWSSLGLGMGVHYSTGIYNGLHLTSLSPQGELHQLGTHLDIIYGVLPRLSIFGRGKVDGLGRQESDFWWTSRSVQLGVRFSL